MSALALDTHAFVKRLTAAGMPEPQAEILADQQAKLIDEKLATKADMTELARALKADIRELEVRFDTKIEVAKSDLLSKIEAAKSDLVRWIFSSIGFQTIVILGAVIALARIAHP